MTIGYVADIDNHMWGEVGVSHRIRQPETILAPCDSLDRQSGTWGCQPGHLRTYDSHKVAHAHKKISRAHFKTLDPQKSRTRRVEHSRVENKRDCASGGGRQIASA